MRLLVVIGASTAVLALSAPASTGTSTPAAAVPPRPHVTFVSDSVGAGVWFDMGARAILAQGVDLSLEIGQGRRLAGDSPGDPLAALSGLQLIPALGRGLGSTVIMCLGYNDLSDQYAANMQAALEALRRAGVEHVLWVTLHYSPAHNGYRTIDDGIAAVAAQHPEVTVVDWDAYAAGHPEWFQSDDVHLAGEGARALARLLHAALVRLQIPAGASAVAADPAPIERFRGATVASPQGVVSTPACDVWLTNEVGSSIGRISADGTVRTYTDPAITSPSAITVGPDGALWFLSGTRSIGRITAAGAVTSFSAASSGSPVGLAAGADGALWFTTGGKSIGRLTPGGAVTTVADAGKMRGTYGIARGPDGAVWYTNYLGASIGRISPDGVVSVYTSPRIRYPAGIAAGPDGALWFADDSGSVGRITTAGVVTSYGSASTVGHPFAIAAGPDGALWATDRDGSLLRITTAGAVTRYGTGAPGFPAGIAAGCGRTVWLAEYTGNAVDRVDLRAAQPAAPRLGVGSRWPAAGVPVARSGDRATVQALLTLDRAASVRLSARDPRGARTLMLQSGSRVGAASLRAPARELASDFPDAGQISVQVVLLGRALRRGSPYAIVIEARSPTGKRSLLRLPIRG